MWRWVHRVAHWVNYSGAIIIIGSYVAASFQHDALSWLRALKSEDSKNFKTRSANLMLDKHAAMWRALFDFDIVANNLHEQGRNLPQPHCTHTHTNHHRQRCESICHANSKPHSHTHRHRHRHIFIVAHSHFHALSLSLLLTLGPSGQRYQLATFASPGYRRRRWTRRCAF